MNSRFARRNKKKLTYLRPLSAACCPTCNIMLFMVGNKSDHEMSVNQATDQNTKFWILWLKGKQFFHKSWQFDAIINANRE